MINCPNCQEILGDNVTSCFKCRYDFKLKRVPNADDLNKANELRREKAREEEAKRKEETERRNKEQQKWNAAQDEYRRIQQKLDENRSKNAYYEYEVVTLRDDVNGLFPLQRYGEILKKYSEAGWRLKCVFSNKINGNIMEETIITFERCIRPELF